MDSGARYVALTHDSSPWVEAQLAFVESICPAPASILEVGAGSGALSASLTRSGYDVVALEPDRAVFEVLLERRQAIHASAERLTPLPIPFRAYTSTSQFDALLALSVYSFLPPTEQVEFVQWAASRLAPGGFVILSALYSRETTATGEWQALPSHDLGLARLAVRVRTCPPTDISQSIEYEYTYLQGEAVLASEVVVQTVYPTQHEKLLALLAQNDLEARALYSSWTGNAYSRGSQFIIVVAERTSDD